MLESCGRRRNAYVCFAFCALIAAAFLLIGSKSSPLYPMNDWVDMHCFFTVGRGWREGSLPYRDLVEQKGPILYAVYALVSMISSGSFIGVFLLEALTTAAFLYVCHQIMQLYLGSTRWINAGLIVLTACFVLSKAFCHGGSLEETTLFMPAYSLLSLLRAQKQKRLLQSREVLLHGILCGICLMTKYTLCGFYFGLALSVLVWYGLAGAWKKLPGVIGWFLLGTALVCAVVSAYFAVHGALDDLWKCYFYNNIFIYTGAGTDRSLALSALEAVKSAGTGLVLRMMENKPMALLILLGFGYLLFSSRPEKTEAVSVLLSFGALAFSTFFTGWSCTYYVLPLFAYAVFGVIAGIDIIRRAVRIKPGHLWLSCGLLGMMMLVSLATVYRKSDNTYLLKYAREEMPQYRFAQRINQIEDATLLNYGFLDGGFYYAAGIIPDCPYFCRLMADIPEMMQVQNAYVKEGRTDFVVTQNQKISDMPWIDTGVYELVDEAQFRFEGDWPVYYLYQRKK